jgi:hypothetical protein
MDTASELHENEKREKRKEGLEAAPPQRVRHPEH